MVDVVLALLGDGYGGHGRARIDGGGSREKRTTGSRRHGGETGRQGALGAILYSVIRDSHVEAGTRALMQAQVSTAPRRAMSRFLLISCHEATGGTRRAFRLARAMPATTQASAMPCASVGRSSRNTIP